MFVYILVCLLSASLAGYLCGRELGLNGRTLVLGFVLPVATALIAGAALSIHPGSAFAMCIASLAVTVVVSDISGRYHTARRPVLARAGKRR
ncbi:MAG: hypothetical protein IPP57_08540 [Candidatus Obscuribacter sp.]|jgi:hypothetical protein|nr:hypothetical protein [Candidatus Obscuribacter sp.]MBK7840099.1 hypothetical protein [Candidatus Obscuribacter sp.]MBK9204070.1 hypothetical protein [Candidatus Obscuribacter sp.]MBK9770854.1 hypothetical protein [Candidatus Obscuribacter sp.]MBL0186400.1 hypothetical protein [Candidatus Obscuribacter sp.]